MKVRRPKLPAEVCAGVGVLAIVPVVVLIKMAQADYADLGSVLYLASVFTLAALTGLTLGAILNLRRG
jgi:hypothetical protein